MADDRSTQSSLKIPIDATKDGSTLLLGDASDHYVGTMSLCFVNAADTGGVPFVGSLTIVGKLRGASVTDGMPWLPIPFRSFFLNGAASDGSMSPGGTVITGTSLLGVPLSGFVLAVVVNCASGAGTLYKQPLAGPATP